MNKSSFFEQFYVAVAKRREYKRLTELTKGQHAKYVIGITFLLLLISYAVPAISFVMGIGGFSDFFMNKLPAFSIENGEMQIASDLDFNLNEIHFVVNDDVEKYVAADVTAEKGLFMLVSKKNIVTNIFGLPMEFVYDALVNQKIDNALIASLAPSFYAGMVMAGVVNWIVLAVGYLLMALIFALFGLPTNKLCGAELSFGKIFVIALYGITVFNVVNYLAVYFLSGLGLGLVVMMAIFYSMNSVSLGIACHGKNPPRSPFEIDDEDDM